MNNHNRINAIENRLSAIEKVLGEIREKVDTSNPVPSENGGIEIAEDVTKLSRARIYTLVSERKIPHAKRGNRLHFNRTNLQNWVAQGARQERGGQPS